MTKYDTYIFLLCLIVFTILTALLTWLIVIIVKQTKRLIRHGAEDEKLQKEYIAARKKKKSRLIEITDKAISIAFCCVFFVIFALSVGINLFGGNKAVGAVPSLKVVTSGSMATRYEGNDYLFKNSIDNQIQTFDLIVVHELPKEEELQLYDIVMYEVDGNLIIHRIIGIEEPNEEHPDERHFRLQGDAVQYPDRFPVRYTQMRGIYREQRVPYVGSFIYFMQSPAGYLCILLVVIVLIITPLLEKHLYKVKKERLMEIGVIDENGNLLSEEEPVELFAPIEEPPEEMDIPSVAVAEEPPMAVALAPSYFDGTRDTRPFAERLQAADDALKARYEELAAYLSRIKDVNVRDSRKYRSFRKGRVAIVRFSIRGKTLHAYLGASPAEYKNSKYVFTDVSDVKEHELFPMRMKVTSDRQQRWTRELIEDIVQRNGFTVQEAPLPALSAPMEADFEEPDRDYVVVTAPLPFFHRLSGTRDMRTFEEKLAEADEKVRARYEEIVSHLLSIPRVKMRKCKPYHTFRRGGEAIAKITLRGKTLNVYLNLDPTEYGNSKYKFTDASAVKAHSAYPMRWKLTSERKVRHVKELITKLTEK